MLSTYLLRVNRGRSKGRGRAGHQQSGQGLEHHGGAGWYVSKEGVVLRFLQLNPHFASRSLPT